MMPSDFHHPFKSLPHFRRFLSLFQNKRVVIKATTPVPASAKTLCNIRYLLTQKHRRGKDEIQLTITQYLCYVHMTRRLQ